MNMSCERAMKWHSFFAKLLVWRHIEWASDIGLQFGLQLGLRGVKTRQAIRAPTVNGSSACRLWKGSSYYCHLYGKPDHIEREQRGV